VTITEAELAEWEYRVVQRPGWRWEHQETLSVIHDLIEEVRRLQTATAEAEAKLARCRQIPVHLSNTTGRKIIYENDLATALQPRKEDSVVISPSQEIIYTDDDLAEVLRKG
jgi:hypothetical protein